MAAYLDLSRVPIDKINCTWEAKEGKHTLRIRITIDCGYKGWSFEPWHPDKPTDKVEVRGRVTGAIHEGFWLPDKIWDALEETEEDAIIDIEACAKWKDDEGKKSQCAKQRFRAKAKLVKQGTANLDVNGVRVNGHEFAIDIEPTEDYYLHNWFTDMIPETEFFQFFYLKAASVTIEIDPYKAKGYWRSTFTDAMPKKGPWADEKQKQAITDPLPAVEPTEEKEVKLIDNWVVIAENPIYGRMLYNIETGDIMIDDWENMQTRPATEEDFIKFGFPNPEGVINDMQTVWQVCKENKEEAELTDEEIAAMVEAAARGQVLPITAEEFAMVAAGLLGAVRMAIKKLTQRGIITAEEYFTRGVLAAETVEEGVKFLSMQNIGKIFGVIKDVGLLALFTGGFAPFIAEEAAQAAGLALFIARNARDPELFREALERYKSIVYAGKEITDKFGWLNPFTQGAFQLYFKAAEDSIAIYEKIPEKIEKELQKEKEREESWKAYMERETEKSLAITINAVADTLKTIYYGIEIGRRTLDVLNRLLQRVTDEEQRAVIERMIQVINERITNISANYDEITGRGLNYACQISDPVMRQSYISYLTTLRDQIEIELMRVEAEGIKVIEKITRKGYLYITGYPRYCRIYLNGEDTRKLTPERFTLEPGTYEVKVERATGETWETTTEVKEGETTEIVYYIPRRRR